MNQSTLNITSSVSSQYLNCSDGQIRKQLYLQAEKVCIRECGSGVLLRGIVEISNYCRNTCCYCGLRAQNTRLKRYRMSREEILTAVKDLYACGLRTVVLQSGEDPELSVDWIARLIEEIKCSFDMAVTLSFGEWPYSYYKKWRDAGADRYLLKIETTEKALYDSLHPGMDFERRLSCIGYLEELGYQTGSGIIIGLPGQSNDSIAADIEFFAAHDFDMISIGPFIPHPASPLKEYPAGSIERSCTAIALTRCRTKNAHLPATSALAATLTDRRYEGLAAGANVIMPNCTPPRAAELYDLYPHRARGHTTGIEPLDQALTQIRRAGRRADYSRGDSLKQKQRIRREAIHE